MNIKKNKVSKGSRLKKKNSNEIVLNLPSDHQISFVAVHFD